MEQYNPINWNAIEDVVDYETYTKLCEQFWLATRMPVSKDKADWKNMSDAEKRLVERVFVGLTALDTLQSEDGIQAIREDARTQHEIAVYNNIQFMESEHAKSYSSIFSTLNTPKEIEMIFDWARNNEFLQRKSLMIRDIYKEGTPLQKKAVSVFLETFSFYSGFYAPLYFLGMSKLINVAEVIKLIIRDESVHGQYIGYKFQLGFNDLDKKEQEELQSWCYQTLYKLYENEIKYTEQIYDEIGWTEDVKVFLSFNANKALMNIGLQPIFPHSRDDVNPVVLNGLSTSTNNHDFFSQVGNGYRMSVVEVMRDEDYDY